MTRINRQKDHHIILCSHPYFIQLGLGVMTTGSLIDWWDTQNGAGIFINRRNFYPAGDPTNTLDDAENFGKVLGLGNGFDETEYFWYGWKPNPDQPLDGRYLRQNISSEYGNDAPSDLKGDGGSWTYTSVIGNHQVSDTQLTERWVNRQIVLGGRYNDDATEMIESTALTNAERLSDSLGPVYGMINMNRWMNAFDNLFPVELWEKDNPETFGNETPNNLFAHQAFLEDIKSSKGGQPCVQWSGEVTMYVGEQDGLLENCSITEWVNFKMYLYDDVQVPTDTKGLALATPKFVGPRRDVATGKQYSVAEDGGWSVSDGETIAADLDVTLNPITKKWESGTPNLFAKLKTDIPKLKNSPDIDRLLANDVKLDLENAEFDNRFVVSSGYAVPIRVQNGNRLQWAPNYANPEDVRCANEDDYEKETLVVYNMSSERTFRKNEEVMLSRIDGRWICTQMGIDPSGEEDVDVPTGQVGRWGEFSYLMTNSDYFFRGGVNADFKTYDPQEMELDFHNRYYTSRGLADQERFAYNANYDYGVSGGFDSITGFDTSSIGFTVPKISQDHGFVQTSSFDWLDSTLFGLRGIKNDEQSNKIGVASTNPTITAAGKNIPVDLSNFTAEGGRNGAHTQGFFGALFPDGYTGADDYAAPRSFQVVSRTVGPSQLGLNGALINNNETLSTDQLPFTDEKSQNNQVDTAFTGRNAAINPIEFDPLQEYTIEDNKMKWYRMFGEETNNEAGRGFHPNIAPASLLHEPSNGNFSLRHIPADVCLNASPESGAFGSPMRSVHRFKNFHVKNDDLAGQLTNIVRAASIQGEYLSKITGDQNNGSSAFDFRPINPNNIMFRPLKFEAYTQFGEQKKGSAIKNIVVKPEGLSRGGNRLGFEAEIHRTQYDYARPITHNFEDREFLSVDDNLWDAEYGLKYGPEPAIQNGYSYRHSTAYWCDEDGVCGNESFGSRSTVGSFFWSNNPRWNPDNLDWTRGGNGFGIITSYTTVAATKSIDFTSDNQYGMGAVIGRNRRGSIPPVYDRRYSWGATSSKPEYAQINVPVLCVRAFHEHPREQTLFDPRTFAVHHFNPDMRYIDDQYMNDNGVVAPLIGNNENGPLKGSPNVSSRNYTRKSIAGRNSQEAITFWYNEPVPSSTVDFSVPSFYAEQIDETRFADEYLHENNEEGTEYYSVPLPVNWQAFRNNTRDPSSNLDAFYPPLMAERFWQIDTVRVGKLLPYAWVQPNIGVTLGIHPDDPEPWVPVEIGVQPSDGTVVDNQDFEGTQDENNGPQYQAQNYANKIIYDGTALESDFQEGDKIGIQSKNFICTVTQAEGGIITRIRIDDPGIFTANDSSSVNTVLEKGFEGPIKFEVISGNGVNLNWSLVNTCCYNRRRIDAKPFMVKKDGQSVVRISSQKNQPEFSAGDGSISEAQSQSFITEQEDVNIILDQTNLAENNSYDVFFHFHNDITMTWLAGKPGYAGGSIENGNGYPVHEQYISARISTT